MPANTPYTRMFVYGTLMRGRRNHHHLAQAVFIAQSRTAPTFRLVDAGQCAALVPEGDTAIEGELYDVNRIILFELDLLEDHPPSLYRSTITLEDGSIAQAYLIPIEAAKQHRSIPITSWRSSKVRSDRASS